MLILILVSFFKFFPKPAFKLALIKLTLISGSMFIFSYFLFATEKATESSENVKDGEAEENKHQGFKKIPVHVMEAFVAKKLGTNYKIINPKDVLVPAKANIIFNINQKRDRFSIQEISSLESAPEPQDIEEDFSKISATKSALKIFEEFVIEPQEKKLNSFRLPKHTPDVPSGKNLSLIVRNKLISVRLLGRTMESGNIGNIIRVRSISLSKTFKARLIDQETGEIIF